MILCMLNEAVACLREGIVSDADLLDAGVVFGTGFAPFRGGPMHYIRTQGKEAMQALLQKQEKNRPGQFVADSGWETVL